MTQNHEESARELFEAFDHLSNVLSLIQISMSPWDKEYYSSIMNKADTLLKKYQPTYGRK